ncbi:hypothetical protein PIB30_101060 [Stylosanthes scabra]|uniref:Uncharacterized protein n=1 Tax=Stylosanthes scabra TaxID=79078 RepID=A0ABU6QZX1_9FABA|nr:hypothetical protein [Stylosanthes scabra]
MKHLFGGTQKKDQSQDVAKGNIGTPDPSLEEKRRTAARTIVDDVAVAKNPRPTVEEQNQDLRVDHSLEERMEDGGEEPRAAPPCGGARLIKEDDGIEENDGRTVVGDVIGVAQL